MSRLSTLQKTLTGAALITSPTHCYYLSRFSFEDGYLLLFPDAAYLVTDFRYEEAARREADPAFTVISPDTGALLGVVDLVKKHRPDTLLVEEEHVTMAFRQKLRVTLARNDAATPITGGLSKTLTKMRQYKDADELADIRRAQAITDAAFTHILDFISPARSEREVALELEICMRRLGADGASFPIIAVSGTQSALPHGTPRELPLQKGFLTMDFGARLNGYCADMTRTVVIGHADEEMRRVYDTVLRAQRSALAAAGIGVSHRFLDTVARDIIDEAGYEGCFGHSLGHGVGLDIHEAPRLSQKAAVDALLTQGEIVTVEPGIYLQGKYGCRIEDMIAVCEDGVCNLTQSTKELLELCR